MLRSFKLAGLQYHGEAGATQTCLDAIVRIIQGGNWVTRASLLTFENRHGFYLQLSEHENIIIRPGFASGYPGEGPAGLAIAIEIFCRHRIKVEEVVVTSGFMSRAANASLTTADMTRLNDARSVRPIRLSDYTWQVLDKRGGKDACVRSQFPLIPNFGLLDARVFDLALMLESDPDSAISKAFRLLEETVRSRCGFKGLVGRNLFERAFLKPDAPLTWLGLEPNEIRGRGELFVGAFSAFRNPRAHRRVQASQAQHLREFMLANELFLLEGEAVKTASTGNGDGRN